MECPKCHTEDCNKTSADGIYRCCNGHTFSVERFSELPGACAGVIGEVVGSVMHELHNIPDTDTNTSVLKSVVSIIGGGFFNLFKKKKPE